MAAYTVALVSDQVREWSSTKGGPMKSYRVAVKDEAGEVIHNVEWARKADSPAPAIGQAIDATIDTSGQYGPKLKLTPSGGFGGGGGPRGRDPKESAQIVRQHSQEMALRYAGLRVEREMLPEPFKLSDLKAVIDWFEADAKAATP